MIHAGWPSILAVSEIEELSPPFLQETNASKQQYQRQVMFYAHSNRFRV